MKKDPLNDRTARRERVAGAQEATMKKFFGGLNGKARREMRRAARKVTGKKETTAEMIERLSK